MITQAEIAEQNKQPAFLVKIIVSTDGYHKEAVHAVIAANKKEAGQQALLCEAHNALIDEGDGWFLEDDDSFGYRVKSVTELSQAEADVFAKYEI